jgi:lauroyl/myristoyl acyltransferase
MKHAGPNLGRHPKRPPLRQGKRPVLAFWALLIALVLALFGWKRQVVRANRAQVVTYLRSRSWSQRPTGLYFALLYHAARDLLGLLTASYPRPLVAAPGSERHLQAMRTGPCLFLTAHVHHFEALGSFLKAKGVPLLAIARPMSRLFAQHWLTRLRQRIDLPVLFSPRGKTPSGRESTPTFLRTTLRHTRSGGCLALLWDQTPPGNAYVTSTFFGAPVRCDSLPLFVLKHCPELPVYAGYLQPDGHVRLTLLFSGYRPGRARPFAGPGAETAAPPAGRATPASSLLARYHRWLMAVTMKHPSYAYWLLHRRFKPV